MQIELQLAAVDDYALSHDYYYDLGVALLTVLSKHNAALANSLHEGAFRNRIKLYAFSPLNSDPKPTLTTLPNGQSGFVLGKRAWMRFAAAWPELVYALGDALLSQGEFNVRGKRLRIEKVEMVKPPAFSDTMVFRPFGQMGTICCRYGKDRRVFFQHPDNSSEGVPSCAELLRENLRHKCLRLEKVRPDIFENLLSLSGLKAEDVIAMPIDVEVLPLTADKPFIKALHYIKTVPVSSFCARVKVTAPEIIQRLVWDCGLGALNSQGFGLVSQWREHHAH